MALAFALLAVLPLSAQSLTPEREYQIAARYAPDFHQSVDRRRPRLDYLTHYRFDGNLRADDNWQNVADPEQPLPAYVYYSVAETRTHFLIHYVVFHPRDWKGNMFYNGGLQVLKMAGRLAVFPLKWNLEVLSAAHENDLEGVLVVVERDTPWSLEGRTQVVESFSHFKFRTFLTADGMRKFEPEEIYYPVRVRNQRPVLYIESRGHGIREALAPQKGRELLAYRYAGRAETPEVGGGRPVGYELLSLHETLWQQAIQEGRSNLAFYKFRLYGQYELADYFGDKPARIGTALRGRKRGRGRAIAPWGWNNNEIRGQWFFDPATNLAERLRPRSDFSQQYYSHRFLAGHRLVPRTGGVVTGPGSDMDP